MSEIQFVNELGDALEAAISRQVTSTRVPRHHRRPRWMRPRLMAAAVVLMVGGGVAGAAIIDQSTTTLVAHGLSCYSGTGNDASAAYNVPEDGQSPTAACATEMGVPAAKLVACANPRIGVVVYESTGDPDQCKSLGLAPLPRHFAAAGTQVHALQRALAAGLQARRLHAAAAIGPGGSGRPAEARIRRLEGAPWLCLRRAVRGTVRRLPRQRLGDLRRRFRA